MKVIYILLPLIITSLLTACGGSSTPVANNSVNDNGAIGTTVDTTAADSTTPVVNNSVNDNGAIGTTVDTTATDPIIPSSLVFSPNVFEDENIYQSRCEAPRSGINPATNSPFPDRTGSVLEENFWLRSWTNRTYLFYREVVDRNPGDFATTQAYFDVLRTQSVTNSGAPRDQFHFTANTAEYFELTNNGASAGYGFRLNVIQASAPRDIRLSYVEPDSPAAQAGLSRGLKIIAIDGVDAINGTDINRLNNGLSPNINETHEFVFEDGNGNRSTVSLTAQSVISTPVLNNFVIDQNGTSVGYLLLNSFSIRSAEEQLSDAFSNFSDQNIDDLVVDLRYNGGGFLAISSQLGYMIAGAGQTNGRTFELLQFNDKHPTIDPVTGRTIEPTPFFNQGLGFSLSSGQALPSVNLQRVFILSTNSTCSASESLINGLRGVGVEVILIGSRTCGKPFGFYPTDNCGTTYFTIQFGGINDAGYGDYTDGFFPSVTDNGEDAVRGCTVADDLAQPLGSIEENMFETALYFIDNNNCPASPLARPAPRVDFNTESAVLNRDSDKRLRLIEQLKLYQ